MTLDASCPRCSVLEESTLHVLRDCAVAKEVWEAIGGINTSDSTWRLPLVEWMSYYLKRDAGVIFGVTCWYLWRARNDWVFSNITCQAPEIAAKAVSWSSSVIKAMERDIKFLGTANPRSTVNVAWIPPPKGWVSINSDGSVDRTRNRATAGGILRDYNGRGILAYTMNLGSCSITRAELRGAIEGLRRTWDAGYMKVLVQIDSLSTISLISGAAGLDHQHAMEVAEFHELQRRDWTIVLRHTYREGNHVADYLTSIGYDYPLGSHTVHFSDCNLIYFVRYDCMGISETRLISIND
ncbi:Putative ribonuclease H protein At1g65750 [Linum perenne]